ncbi:hypothetical protein [Paraburkholderia dipogonis]
MNSTKKAQKPEKTTKPRKTFAAIRLPSSGKRVDPRQIEMEF